MYFRDLDPEILWTNYLVTYWPIHNYLQELLLAYLSARVAKTLLIYIHSSSKEEKK